VTVSLQEDDGQASPALVIQSDLLIDLDSVVLCPVTSDLKNAVFRVTVEPNPTNGLRALSLGWIGGGTLSDNIRKNGG